MTILHGRGIGYRLFRWPLSTKQRILKTQNNLALQRNSPETLAANDYHSEINVKPCTHRNHSSLQSSCRVPGRFAFRLLCTCLLIISCSGGTGFSAEKTAPETPGKIIYLPFTVKTDKPQQYLEEGLTDILATRMTNRTGLIAVHRSSQTRKLAELMQQGDQQALKDMLGKINADYLVIGSLEQQKTGYELLIYMFSRNKGTPASFSKHISTIDRAIPALDELAIEVAAQVFNKKTEPVETAAAEEKGISGFQTAHPDRAYREGLYQPAAILGIDGDQFKVLSRHRSRTIKAAIRAMTVGDLDGDGSEEIVMVAHGKLSIYRFRDDHFQHVADEPIANHLAPNAVSLADFDKNGLQEIYISANNGDKPASQVLEWDGSVFNTLHKDVPYYLRPGLNEKGIRVLIGQREGPTGPAGRSFYQIAETADGKLDKQKKISVPRGFNLFDFIRADLDQDGTLEIIGITTKNKLLVMDQTGTPIWKSEENYGASKAFLGTLSSNRTGTPTYMHTRLIARDQDGDSKPEIIIGRNRLATVKFFKRVRYFEGSSISALSWDGTEMTPLWETGKTAGYTTDYQVTADSDRSGISRLFFVESDSSYPFLLWESENSVLHMYEMGRKNDTQDVTSSQP